MGTIPKIPYSPVEPKTHYRLVGTNKFACGLAADLGTEVKDHLDVNCDHCIKALEAYLV